MKAFFTVYKLGSKRLLRHYCCQELRNFGIQQVCLCSCVYIQSGNRTLSYIYDRDNYFAGQKESFPDNIQDGKQRENIKRHVPHIEKNNQTFKKGYLQLSLFTVCIVVTVQLRVYRFSIPPLFTYISYRYLSVSIYQEPYIDTIYIYTTRPYRGKELSSQTLKHNFECFVYFLANFNKPLFIKLECIESV